MTFLLCSAGRVLSRFAYRGLLLVSVGEKILERIRGIELESELFSGSPTIYPRAWIRSDGWAVKCIRAFKLKTLAKSDPVRPFLVLAIS